ncbi:hypothetical protein SSAG_00590 [Streptomyces sp. Mg1]|nr:hypothetical protein SSAG_00590 [Streptomyces sp. Mg1]
MQCQNCAAVRLPAVPAATTALGPGDETDQPQDQDCDSHPPKNLHRETRAEEEKDQQKNEKQGNHSYQPPKHRVPCRIQDMHSFLMCFLSWRLGRRSCLHSTNRFDGADAASGEICLRWLA